MTKPSRFWSQGREALGGSSLKSVESARAAAKPARPIRQTAASAPPATITSASSQMIMRAASPIACAPLEHAVTTAWLGPENPYLMDTWPEARLIRFDGMKKGETRRGPFSWSVMTPSMMPGSPPIPDPISTPVRSRFSASSGFQPESSTACIAAVIAKTMNSSILRWSLGGTHSSALKRPEAVSPRGTTPAIFAGRSDTSNAWMAAMPDWLASKRRQFTSTPQPSGVTIPIPVITTRLIPIETQPADGARRAAPMASSAMRLDKADRVLHRHDLLRGIIGDLAAELLLECHDEFHGVEAVGAEVIDETRVLGHLGFVDPQVLHHDFFNPIGDIAHNVYLNSCIEIFWEWKASSSPVRAILAPVSRAASIPPPKVPSHIIVPSGLPIGRGFLVSTRRGPRGRLRSSPFRHSHEGFGR